MEEILSKDVLFESNYEQLKKLYRSGKIQKINEIEYSILEFCHGRDMIKFLREEFKRNPIDYAKAEEEKNPINYINMEQSKGYEIL